MLLLKVVVFISSHTVGRDLVVLMCKNQKKLLIKIIDSLENPSKQVGGAARLLNELELLIEKQQCRNDLRDK